MKFVPGGSINNKPSLVRVMACRLYRRQAITRINVDPVHQRTLASAGPNVSSPLETFANTVHDSPTHGPMSTEKDLGKYRCWQLDAVQMAIYTRLARFVPN